MGKPFKVKLVLSIPSEDQISLENLKNHKSISIRLKRLEDLIMTVKEKLQENADKVQAELGRVGDALTNLTGDIQKLNTQLAAAGTPEDVDNILGPKIDALKQLADGLAQLAAVVPEDTPTEPPAEPL